MPLRLLELSDVLKRICHLPPFPPLPFPPCGHLCCPSSSPSPLRTPSPPVVLIPKDAATDHTNRSTTLHVHPLKPVTPWHTNHFTVSIHAPISVFLPNHEIFRRPFHSWQQSQSEHMLDTSKALDKNFVKDLSGGWFVNIEKHHLSSHPMESSKMMPLSAKSFQNRVTEYYCSLKTILWE